MSTSSHTSKSPSIIISESLQEAMLSEMDIHNSSFNILLIGPSQAGKSTLVEAFKKYSDPTQQPNKSAIGVGVSSHTSEVQETIITSTLPTYKVFQSPRTKDGSNEPGNKRSVVQVDALYAMSIEDYEDELDRRDGLYMQQTFKMGAKHRHFCIYDTPGLNDTNNFDESHVEKIFSVLNNIRTIHLVLMVIGPTPFTPGIKTAIKNYIEIFPSFNGIFAFVHTQTDYKRFHPENTSFHNFLRERNNILEELAGSRTIPYFIIDCDLHRPTPIRECITQNIIRKILRLATFNKPVVMDKIFVRKTEKMREIDKLIADRVGSIIRSSLPSVTSQSSLVYDPLDNYASQVYNLDVEIKSLQEDLKKTMEFLQANDNDELIIIYENRYDEGWTVAMKPRERFMTFRSPGYSINKKAILTRNVKILRENEGLDFWDAEFERKPFQEGTLHVKLYTKRRNKYRDEIYEYSSKMYELQGKIANLEWKRTELLDRHREHNDAISERTNKYNESISLIQLASSQFLNPDIFKSLVSSKAYSNSLLQNSENVENVYLQFIRSPEQPQRCFKEEEYRFIREDSDSDDDSA